MEILLSFTFLRMFTFKLILLLFLLLIAERNAFMLFFVFSCVFVHFHHKFLRLTRFIHFNDCTYRLNVTEYFAFSYIHIYSVHGIHTYGEKAHTHIISQLNTYTISTDFNGTCVCCWLLSYSYLFIYSFNAAVVMSYFLCLALTFWQTHSCVCANMYVTAQPFSIDHLQWL